MGFYERLRQARLGPGTGVAEPAVAAGPAASRPVTAAGAPASAPASPPPPVAPAAPSPAAPHATPPTTPAAPHATPPTTPVTPHATPVTPHATLHATPPPARLAPRPPAPAGGSPSRRPRPPVDPALRERVQKRLAGSVRAGVLTGGQQLAPADRQAVLRQILAALADEEGVPPLEHEAMAAALYDDLLGYGPLQPLLDDPEVTEVMVNGPDQVYVERRGLLHRTDVRFEDEQQVLGIIERIVAPLGRRIDESSPMVDARLPDGSRVNAIIAPLSLRGPAITIRKFATTPITVADMVEWGTLTEAMAVFLDACVRARLNIIVSGGTGSGKTTMLNTLSSFIPDGERIVTIEDAAELQLRQAHVVPLEARPANIEGRGEIAIRHLVRNSLRMRPDRIVVGECRGGEALDMLQAMNTGHDGSLTTGHANSPRDMIARLETMVLMAGVDLPVRAIREQIASALDLIVHCARLRDGTRRVTHITEVQGMEGDVVVLQDLFCYRQHGVDAEGRVQGSHAPTGIRPRFYEQLESHGCALPPDLFVAGAAGATAGAGAFSRAWPEE